MPPVQHSFLHESKEQCLCSVARGGLMVSKSVGVVQLPVCSSSSGPRHLFTQLTSHFYVNGVVRYTNHQAVAPRVTGALRTRATQAGPPRSTYLLTPDFVYKRKRGTRKYSVQQSLVQLCKSKLCHVSIASRCAATGRNAGVKGSHEDRADDDSSPH